MLRDWLQCGDAFVESRPFINPGGPRRSHRVSGEDTVFLLDLVHTKSEETWTDTMNQG